MSRYICIRPCLFMGRRWRVSESMVPAKAFEDKVPRHFVKQGSTEEDLPEDLVEEAERNPALEALKRERNPSEDINVVEKDGRVRVAREGDDRVPLEELETWEADRLRDYLKDVCAITVPPNYRRDYCLNRIKKYRANRLDEARNRG
jgi:hypothetical protein